LWPFCANIERGLQVRRQHTMPRRTTNRTRLGLQGNLCSTACTKSGHVLYSPVGVSDWMTAHPAKIQDGVLGTCDKFLQGVSRRHKALWLESTYDVRICMEQVIPDKCDVIQGRLLEPRGGLTLL
jgi:hypothetical protein